MTIDMNSVSRESWKVIRIRDAINYTFSIVPVTKLWHEWDIKGGNKIFTSDKSIVRCAV